MVEGKEKGDRMCKGVEIGTRATLKIGTILLLKLYWFI